MDSEPRPELLQAYHRLQSLRNDIERLSNPELAQLIHHSEMLVTILENLNLAKWLHFDVGNLAQVARLEVERRSGQKGEE